ncbi:MULTISPECIES: PaaX family transcriptional regulator C-terminal domain-containing protein [Roseobacteraceae]|uniref:ArsR family transcriptional regulator n=1 Tax=Celeribacter baekdonensis TaxID=875171 RepID=A0A2R4M9J8_9RHOB|nr:MULTISPECIES: PaaX family transcriptional regulator C-terminal domain-containing protein [Roseobacteraceae]AVW93702.1 ArsR family transcriptional regulator [Celeribacter baekdonensis]KAB6714608.1 ArsR family transcriptional regulator [Roseobacter sp. TSBP12]
MTDPLLTVSPPRAPDFIVTIYGDVVEPRGGTLWMGALIECCAEHGISESLVRTAVSRLVSSGRLEGARLGRKSFYRLSTAAQAEFRDAARILFDSPPTPESWLVALREPDACGEAPFPWVRLASGVALAPARTDLRAIDGVIFEAHPVSGHIPALAAQNWPLCDVATAYKRVIDRYAHLMERLDEATASGSTALTLRLRLVDDYRRAALADPQLPLHACPDEWPADAAQDLFTRLYLALSPAADRHIAAQFQNQSGFLPRDTKATLTRLARLRASLA